ncbi:ABC transporter permease [Panacibacter sp. DH6]|uniref:ABC transporter permease n=2 Tax=Panacibacter microcysteis TaxID=2793269 RepID=A0A931E1Y9_9BACT|nr:ABC transporter permease [Panacibacter microcysteis]
MFKNYFKVAVRSLLRKKIYTVINIAGLAVGIAVCMMIFLVIQFQTSFEDFHTNKDRVYRLLTESYAADAGNTTYAKNVPFPLPGYLRAALPQLQEVVPVYASSNDEIQVAEAGAASPKNFKEQRGVFYTSPSFFKLFSFPLLAGSYASLNDPNNVLLTKEIATTYFGNWQEAMGKTIKIKGYYSMGAALFQFPATSLKVSGILATIPANTDFQLKLVIAYGTDFTGDAQFGFQQPGWNGTAPDFGCYVLLPENTAAESFNQQLRNHAQQARPADSKDNYILQPVSDIHYDAVAGNYSNKIISRELVNVLWLIAAFILLIACVNFINLSTAQAVNRAKEVGVRKVLGSNKLQLQVQFIVETLLIVSVAVLLAFVITLIALPYINDILELSLPFSMLFSKAVLLFIVTVAAVVTVLAGFYPSVVLSRFNPVNALRSKLAANTIKGISLRRALVVFQFVIAQALIVGTLVIVQQMNYFMDQPLGFDKNTIVNIAFRPDSTGGKLTSYLKQQLLSNGIQSVSFNSNSPMEENNMFTGFRYNNATKDAGFEAISKFVDDDYVATFHLQLVAGKNLQPSGWTKEFLVNESFVKALGLTKPEDIIGKEISMMNGLIKCPVVGVVKDFHNRSLRRDLAPLIMATNSTMYRQASVKLSTAGMAAGMQYIKKLWEQTLPDNVYEYSFLDEKIASFYKQETQLAVLYKIFAGIAIFLSCLGLYGLASFMAVQRIKEVGIRKVLGAGTGSIVYLFSKEFIILIAVAFVIATPVAWYYMHQWLEDYTYRISISWWLFAAGGLAAVFIALATISFQAVKAAVANPVKSLRTE